MPKRLSQDQQMLEGVRTGNPKVLEQIYANYHLAIRDLVFRQGGSLEDAKDIFQEGLMIVYQKSKDETFVLSSSLFTFLYSVCRNILRNKISKQKRRAEVTLNEEMKSIDIGESVNELEKNEAYFLYREKFCELGTDCQKILSMAMDKISMKEIMRVMGFGSEGYAKKRKFMCKKKLIQLIEQDPRYKELHV